MAVGFATVVIDVAGAVDGAVVVAAADDVGRTGSQQTWLATADRRCFAGHHWALGGGWVGHDEPELDC